MNIIDLIIPSSKARMEANSSQTSLLKDSDNTMSSAETIRRAEALTFEQRGQLHLYLNVEKADQWLRGVTDQCGSLPYFDR